MELYDNLISHQFSPCGRVRDPHLLRYQGLAVVYYGCILECLANERLEHVKYPGRPECFMKIDDEFFIIKLEAVSKMEFWSKFKAGPISTRRHTKVFRGVKTRC